MTYSAGLELDIEKCIELEYIPTDPHNTGGTTTVVFIFKSVRLKTLTEVGSTFNSNHLDAESSNPLVDSEVDSDEPGSSESTSESTSGLEDSASK